MSISSSTYLHLYKKISAHQSKSSWDNNQLNFSTKCSLSYFSKFGFNLYWQRPITFSQIAKYEWLRDLLTGHVLWAFLILIVFFNQYFIFFQGSTSQFFLNLFGDISMIEKYFLLISMPVSCDTYNIIVIKFTKLSLFFLWVLLYFFGECYYRSCALCTVDSFVQNLVSH